LQRYGADYRWEFEKPKIIYPEVSADPRFAVDYHSYFTDKTTFIIPIEQKQIHFVLALANSKLMSFFHKNLGSMMRGRYFMNSKIYIEQMPIYRATEAQIAPITDRVSAILDDPDSTAVRQLEAEIDQLIYSLYNLTREEIQIVEGGN
jgi:adenine-specific DNA-methyltransferase